LLVCGIDVGYHANTRMQFPPAVSHCVEHTTASDIGDDIAPPTPSNDDNAVIDTREVCLSATATCCSDAGPLRTLAFLCRNYRRCDSFGQRVSHNNAAASLYDTKEKINVDQKAE